MTNQVMGFVGLFGGALMGLTGWWLGRYFARKKNGLDERYYAIWQKAKSTSWFCTTFAIYILFTLVLCGIQLQKEAILGILLTIHLFSWSFAGVYYNWKM
jgi:membrane protein YqaA with SNARE-associated domain